MTFFGRESFRPDLNPKLYLPVGFRVPGTPTIGQRRAKELDEIFETLEADVGYTPLLPSKLQPIPDSFPRPPVPFSGEEPAPLDEVSMINGCLKFDRPHYCPPDSVREAAQTILSYYFEPHLVGCRVLTDEEVEAKLELLAGSGVPWRSLIGNTKGSVLKRYSIKQLCDYFEQNFCVVTAVLKDETRPPGKDARLFRMACVATIVWSTKYLGDFSDRLVAACGPQSVSAVGASSPGQYLTDLYRRLYEFPNVYSIDGSWNDARFPLWFAQELLVFTQKFVDNPHLTKYFSLMYNGYTVVLGRLLRLVGNPSGHLLTAAHNTMLAVFHFAYACLRQGMTTNDIFFRCCGDDTIGGTRVPLDLQRALCEMAEWGYAWEIMDPDLPFSEKLFVGTHPVWWNNQLTYVYRESILDGLLYWTGNCDNYFDKAVNITTLFYHSTHFAPLVLWVHQLAEVLRVSDEKKSASLRLLTSASMNHLYKAWESCAGATLGSLITFPV